jgi:multiple sugar transport system substrate-binding protein
MITRVLAAGALAMAAAQGADAQTLRVTVAEYSAKTGPYFEEAAAAFEEGREGVDVQIEVVPWDVLLQKLTTDISAGANADLSIIGTRWLLDFVEQGIAAPLDPYMDEAFRDRFIEVFLEPSVMDGQTYGLPVAASARAMYYNRDLMEQAGVEEVPETWEDLREAASAIDALGEDVHGFGLQGAEIETDVYFYYALWSHGGDLIEEDGTSGLDSEAAFEAARLYEAMIDEGATQPGVTSNTREDVQALFKQGQVGFMITAPFLSAQIREEVPDLDHGVAAIPACSSRSRL